jgi:hypothetical protein
MVTATPALRLDYSPLDLYLMGLVPPEAVGPIRLLVGDNSDLLGCNGTSLTAASPPQTCGEQPLKGSWLELGIEDVIAAEGPRIPGSSPSPAPVSVGVFVLDNTSGSWTEVACEHLKKSLADRLSDFEAATGHRLALTNGVPSGSSCGALVERTRSPELSLRGGCNQSVSRSRSRRAWGWMLVLLAMLPLRRHRSNRG